MKVGEFVALVKTVRVPQQVVVHAGTISLITEQGIGFDDGSFVLLSAFESVFPAQPPKAEEVKKA